MMTTGEILKEPTAPVKSVAQRPNHCPGAIVGWDHKEQKNARLLCRNEAESKIVKGTRVQYGLCAMCSAREGQERQDKAQAKAAGGKGRW
jgi:hypothetical protein